MSRHRNVRTMNYDDEYDDDDDYLGHSVEDDCISPTDAQQWMYDRAKGQQSISAFLANNRDIEEEDDDGLEAERCAGLHTRRDSECYQLPELNDEDRVRLNSCMDEIRNIVGESVTDKQLVEAIMKHGYNFDLALDDVLNSTKTPPTASVSSPIVTAAAKTVPKMIEKGIGDRLLEKSDKLLAVKAPAADVVKPSILVTPTAKKTANVTMGFEISSPRVQSPSVSGRNTPEITNANNQTPKPLPKELQRNGLELFKKERGADKQHIHMVVIGHVDAGKSTLMGHLLCDTGNIPQRVMHKNEQESKKMGKQSFMYAWVLDETGEERERGITMDVGSSRFETPNKTITLLDAPGHKDFIPNMISGANQADVALLVVDATRGEFETGFEQGGQTREHALLVRSLGVNQLGVVVNKLDTVNWSKERFDEIVGKLRFFLKQAGFKDSDVTYVPCSGLTGQNLVKDPTDGELLKWYKGPTLLKVIDAFKTPARSVDKPFRMSISDIFKGTGSGFCISGRIESGVVCVNDRVLVCPSKEQAVVKNITIDELQYTTCFAGDQVSITLANVEAANMAIGFILSDIHAPIPLATRIRARIVVFNIKVPITMGYPVLLHHQSLIEPATIHKLKAQLHKGTGEVVKKNPRCLGNNSCALVDIEFQRPVCMERYADCKELGRIMLRVSGVTIAAGLVTDIVK
ncbi:eukaryotic peptide chain release factor GTP-binding subunit [Culex quinquefasciatus]|uniref:Eukaryotic peptide chain release factor GTP-binding subunit n=1 Tax=Culex quinquefasciatus TaxID=7176 RepID=B0X1I9_CULQU|nr:eukaryotic peptide chain release factor GTP-binding subunit [Culex quinquefasciatus]|eukprot:XP_001863511.1 eukaryotic peptide chain release factor GTP-binding subunit [Culex quinquefasciatus]